MTAGFRSSLRFNIKKRCNTSLPETIFMIFGDFWCNIQKSCICVEYTPYRTRAWCRYRMTEVLVDHWCNLLVQQTFQGYEAPFGNSGDLESDELCCQVGERGRQMKNHEITDPLGDSYTACIICIYCIYILHTLTHRFPDNTIAFDP